MPTKLGPHAILTTEPGLAWARRAPIVKSLRLDVLKAARPEAILIFRHHWPDQGNALKQGGSWAAAVVIGKLQGFRHPRLYLEGMNETCQRLGHGLEQYVVWQQQFSDYCHARGYKVAGFSFSTGNPEPEDWWYVQDHGFGGLTKDDVISLHQYWGIQGFGIYNACRHRMVHGWLDGDHPPMLITECGRDRVEGGKGGWQLDGVSEEQYLAELRAFDAHIMADLYIWGATPFTSGPTGDWGAFGMDDISDRIAGGDPMPPTPPTEPTIKDYLANMWRRAGVDVNMENDAMWDYCLDLSERGTKAIVPQPTQGGDYQNWDHSKYVVGFTTPIPLWMEKGIYVVHEGFPPLA